MKKLLIVIGVVAALAGIGTTLSAKSGLYTTPNCGASAIVKCGTFNQKQLNAGLTSDVKAVYSKYGIDTNLSAAKDGTLKANGDVVVGGKVVATGAQSIGRNAKSGTTTVTIAGKKYHIHSAKSAFLGYDTPVFVFLNKDGSFRGAIAKVCGNPIIAKPVPVKKIKVCELATRKIVTIREEDFNSKKYSKNLDDCKPPVYSCDSLTAKISNRTDATFNGKATAKDGATIVSYTFTFGDGKSTTVKNPTGVKHTYANPGTYTAKMSVTFKVNGKETVKTDAKCATKVTVEKPPVVVKPVYTCDNLTATIKNRTDATFNGKATAKDGATIVNYIFDFGDGKSATVTNPTGVTHTYANPGTYTAKMSVTFKVDGKNVVKTGADCATKVTVEKPPVVITPVYTCDSLSFKLIDRKATFTGKATAKDGAVIKNYTFDFGDKTAPVTVTNPAGVVHEYAEEGTYTATLSVTVTVNGADKTVTDADCAVKVTIPTEEKPPVECKPGIPEGDERCEEKPPVTPPVEKCEIPGKEHLPKDSKDCVETPVTELPTTGIGDFMPVLGAGSLIAAIGYYIASRRLT